ncbi:NupC/NupG family nucleoside CNT transporter [Kaarinaea lacus]
MQILQSVFGLIVIILIAWLISEKRSQFPRRVVVVALAMQFLLALLLLKIPLFNDVFAAWNNALLSLEQATRAGTVFVFGYLGGGELPFAENKPGASFILAFRALPLILVVSALSSLLFYWRILPWVVKGFSKALQKSLGVGGALGVGTAANVFVGMVEAPLLVRPYLKNMSRGELFALMSTGMATIAGTVIVLYASILSSVIPDALGHVLAASIISAPAALLIAIIMVPLTGETTQGEVSLPKQVNSSMDAITQGTLQGVQLLINIIAMLVVLVALVSLVNLILGLLPEVGGQAITLQRLLGLLMAPLMWLLGIPMQECLQAGALMATKTVLNEFIAYIELSQLQPDALSERSRFILVYAMCGFANFGSLGIMLGGLTTMVPERRAEIVQLGLKSIVAGTLATMMTGSIVGIII